MYKHLLIPTDGSKLSNDALERAVARMPRKHARGGGADGDGCREAHRLRLPRLPPSLTTR